MPANDPARSIAERRRPCVACARTEFTYPRNGPPAQSAGNMLAKTTQTVRCATRTLPFYSAALRAELPCRAILSHHPYIIPSWVTDCSKPVCVICCALRPPLRPPPSPHHRRGRRRVCVARVCRACVSRVCVACVCCVCVSYVARVWLCACAAHSGHP